MKTAEEIELIIKTQKEEILQEIINEKTKFIDDITKEKNRVQEMKIDIEVLKDSIGSKI